MAKRKQKTDGTVSAARVQMARLTAFDPLSGLKPELLSQYHEQFRRGWLRNAVLLWDRIEETDDKVKTVVPKRRKGVARHGYEFVFDHGMEDDPRAQQHQKTLQYFYDHLSVSSAMDLNERGGFPMLCRHMMDAVGKRYAVHEILWDATGDGLTAELRFVPLQFFENTTGRLRYLPSDAALYGTDLDEGGWMVTVGEGLMPATAVCYMYKRLPLRDWLVYCYKRGGTGIDAETSAVKGSTDWNDVEDAVKNFGLDLALVHGPGTKISPIDVSAQGELPYPALVDLMNRAIVTLWRGGDLSTMSAGGDSVGASVQGNETDLLEEDDAGLLTETLNEQLDRWVIRYAFGEEPLCWVKVKTGQRQDVKQDLEIDRGLSDLGFQHTAETLAQRYNRTLPEGDETVIEPRSAAGVAAPAGAGPGATPAPTPEPAADAAVAPAAPVIADSVQETALNGAQIQALVGILSDAATRKIPDGAVQPIIRAAFPQLKQELLDQIIAALRGFTPPVALANAQPSAPADLVAAGIEQTQAERSRQFEAWLQGLTDLAEKPGITEEQFQAEAAKRIAALPADLLTPGNIARLAEIGEAVMGTAVINSLEGETPASRLPAPKRTGGAK